MPCYHPMTGYYKSDGSGTLTFNKAKGYIDRPITINCGQCIGCRLEKSRQWAIRCVHEAQMHEQNMFLTLTYDEKHHPKGGTLIKKHFQDFIKRYRSELAPKKIRYFHCGEYGSKTARPHYHALIFGHEFGDQELYTQNKHGDNIYISERLNKIWGKGQCWIGAVTFNSAAYTARYITKKITGEKAKEHYKSVDPDTGEITDLEPEYITMSLKPGIGYSWYQKYKKDVYPEDVVIINGMKMKPPKYYADLYEKENFRLHKQKRIKNNKFAKQHEKDQTPERLAVREKVKQSKMKQLTRDYEED